MADTPVISPERRAAAQFRDIRQTPLNIRMPDFKSVAAASTASILAPVGLTYHAMMFKFTIAGVAATRAQIIAQVSRIKLSLGGTVKIDLTGAEAVYLYELYFTRSSVTPLADGILPVWMAKPYALGASNQDSLAWGLADVGSFNVEVTLGAGATINAIVANGWCTKGTPLGRHLVIRRTGDNQAAAGTKVISDFTKGADIQLLAVHFDKDFGNAGPITNIEVKADQNVLWEGDADFIKTLIRNYELATGTGFTTVPFTARGRTADSILQIAQDFRITLTTTTLLGNFAMLTEQIETYAP